jgi:hypothetical protein
VEGETMTDDYVGDELATCPSDDNVRLVTSEAQRQSILRALGYASLNGALWSADDESALALIQEAEMR